MCAYDRCACHQDNTIVPILSVDPPVTAEPLLAVSNETATVPINSGCGPLENADEMVRRLVFLQHSTTTHMSHAS